jgi:predicted RND superfamily exporter protein
MSNHSKDAEQVASEPEHFLLIKGSEAFLEKWLFLKPKWVLGVACLLTLIFFVQALGIQPDARIEKLIPLQHPFIQNYLKYKEDLGASVSQLKIVVAVKQEDIFSAEYFERLQKITDEVFFIKGVDRSGLKSLWTPNVRWTEVTAEGFQGGPIFSSSYQGTEADIEQVKVNILKSGQVGRLVANDFSSTLIDVPLYELDPETGKALSYTDISKAIETRIRDTYQDESTSIHVLGVPKLIADLIEGFKGVFLFFIIAVVITFVLLIAYLKSMNSSLMVLGCSLSAVIWQLGIIKGLGFGIDPYSVLVPFLIFAIAVSHGVQIKSSILQWQINKGMNALSAARLAFRQLYVPGMLALISDAIGFLTLMFIDIGVIQELAITASIGIAAIIVTNLFVLPVLAASMKPSVASVQQVQQTSLPITQLCVYLSQFAEKKQASQAFGLYVVLMIAGVLGSMSLEIGDLDKGAPELRPDSVYNRDTRYVVEHYSTSSDVLVVMVETPPEGCILFPVIESMDALMWRLNNLESVQGTISLATVAKRVTKGFNEGNPSWEVIPRNQSILNTSLQRAPPELINAGCTMTPMAIYLDDHRADTLKQVIKEIEAFKQDNDSDNLMTFALAAGNAGIEAATNEVIEQAQYRMLVFVYVVVGLMCWVTFRTWRALVCIIAPLVLTSFLCQALMAVLGIGIKVATLPVIVLGVGIGVDYGIYIFSKYEAMLIRETSPKTAYLETLLSTGKAVSFTGFTLAIGVATWLFSDIKFQADMGVILTFMFLWNMVGALVFIPAFAAYLIDPDQLKVRHQREHGAVEPA